MPNRKIQWAILLFLLTGYFAFSMRTSAGSCQEPQETSGQPDNTKKNLPTSHRDANRADQQSNSSADVELTRKIRQALTQDKSLSIYARNIKIITRNGLVHLKGPVRSQTEKDAVEAKAMGIVGTSNVKSELTIKSQ